MRLPKLWCLFGLSLGCCAAEQSVIRPWPRRPSVGIDPRFAKNLTLYHVNELAEGNEAASFTSLDGLLLLDGVAATR